MKKLEWDSTFFGLSIYKIDNPVYTKADIEKKCTDAFNSGADLIYVFSNNSEIQHIFDIPPIKKAVTYSMDTPLKDKKSSNKNSEDRISEINDASPLLDLACLAGHDSRFNDPRIPENKFKELYHTWIKKSVDHSLADKVLVWTDNNIPYGFITVKISKECASIGLIAVDPGMMGRGVGKALVNEALKIASENGCTKMTVDTQESNSGACCFYEHCGFHRVSEKNVFHIWRDQVLKFQKLIRNV